MLSSAPAFVVLCTAIWLKSVGAPPSAGFESAGVANVWVEAVPSAPSGETSGLNVCVGAVGEVGEAGEVGAAGAVAAVGAGAVGTGALVVAFAVCSASPGILTGSRYPGIFSDAPDAVVDATAVWLKPVGRPPAVDVVKGEVVLLVLIACVTFWTALCSSVADAMGAVAAVDGAVGAGAAIFAGLTAFAVVASVVGMA